MILRVVSFTQNSFFFRNIIKANFSGILFFSIHNYFLLLNTIYAQFLQKFLIIGCDNVFIDDEDESNWIDIVDNNLKFFTVRGEDAFTSFTSFYLVNEVSAYFEDFYEEDLLVLKSDIAFLKTKNVYRLSILDTVEDLTDESNQETSDEENSDDEDIHSCEETASDNSDTSEEEIICTTKGDNTSSSSDESGEDVTLVSKNTDFLSDEDTIPAVDTNYLPPLYSAVDTDDIYSSLNEFGVFVSKPQNLEDDEENLLQLKPINTTSRFKLIFNENRKLLIEFFNLKKLRQKKFNRTFINFVKGNSYQMLLMMELNFVNILLRTNLIFSKNLINIFISKKLIYLNGFSIVHTNHTLVPGDRIQFLIDKTFFFLYRYLLNYNIELQKKASIVAWKLVRFNFNFYKQKSESVPKWVVDLIHLNAETPKFVEVDYSILTAVVLFKPFFYYDFSFYNLMNINFFLSRLYLWKYIV